MSERKLKEFLTAEQCVGKVVSKIVWTPNYVGSCTDGENLGGSIAIHFGQDQVAVFIFGDDFAGCWYASDPHPSFGVNIEDEGELADYEASADELELWRPE